VYMSRKHQRVRELLIGAAVLPILLLCYELWSYYFKIVPVEYIDMVMGIPVIDNTSHIEGKERISFESMLEKNVCLEFENTILPIDSDGYVYVSQGRMEDWNGNITVSNQEFYVCMLWNEYLQQKDVAIRENCEFILYIVGEEEYCETKLVVSGMPIVSVTTERMEEQPDIPYEVDPDKKYYGSEPLYYGNITVFNPDVNVENYEIVEARVRYHQKGATSAAYPKQSYAISLQNHKEENVDVSLLGMRSDNAWKLNSLYSDESRIREKTAAEIWEVIDSTNEEVNESGPRMEYVELILDNEYQGVYCLVEPVDEKKLDLDSNDILYKVIGWDMRLDEELVDAAQKGWKISYPIRIRYPEEISDYMVAWNPMRNYMNVYYRDTDSAEVDILRYVDVSNVVDMAIFTMAVSGSDNYYKNMYYVARKDKTGKSIMYQLPWDLDLTFGNVYCYGADRSVAFSEDYTAVYLEKAFQVLADYYPNEIGVYVVARWEQLREGVLATENIRNVMTNNLNYLIQTGALEREKYCWPEGGIEDDISYLLEFQEKRMQWLDETYHELWVVTS